MGLKLRLSLLSNPHFVSFALVCWPQLATAPDDNHKGQLRHLLRSCTSRCWRRCPTSKHLGGKRFGSHATSSTNFIDRIVCARWRQNRPFRERRHGEGAPTARGADAGHFGGRGG